MANYLNQSQPELAQSKTESPHQEAMIKACEEGRLDELEKLFDEHGVKYGDDPVWRTLANEHGFNRGDGPIWRTEPEGAPETHKLFASAIINGHLSIIRYLKLIYPKYNFDNGWIVHALFEKPDFQVLELICSYSPTIVNYSSDNHMTTIVSIACAGGPKNAPFVKFLFDRGADASRNEGYAWHFGGDMLDAIEHNQPIEIIQLMLPTIDNLSFPIFAAVSRKRADALEVMLNEELRRGQTHAELPSAKKLLDEMREKGDEQLIAVAERHVSKVEQRIKKSTRGKACSSPKWWPFRADAMSKDKVDAQNPVNPTTATKVDAQNSTNPTTTVGAGVSTWWHRLSLGGSRPQPADEKAGKHKEELETSTSDEDSLKEHKPAKI
jgi:hypothetical protein